MPVVLLDDLAAVAVGSLAWVLASVLVGYRAHRLGDDDLDRDTRWTRLRSWEAGGRWYEHRLAIRSWKDRLPEAGDLFEGGVSKRRLPAPNPAGLERFVRETRRAERTHWTLLACTPIFALWSPPVVLAAMATFALVANVPCLLVQRYNRARLLRVLARVPAPGSVTAR